MAIYKKIAIDGVKIFYREAGALDKPTMILFHGFPSSSHMFRDLIPMLKENFHLIAPDYPGFEQSDMPSRENFAYTFDNLANVMEKFLNRLGVDKFFMYVFDYGAPIGFRLAVKNPQKIAKMAMFTRKDSVKSGRHAPNIGKIRRPNFASNINRHLRPKLSSDNTLSALLKVQFRPTAILWIFFTRAAQVMMRFSPI